MHTHYSINFRSPCCPCCRRNFSSVGILLLSQNRPIAGSRPNQITDQLMKCKICSEFYSTDATGLAVLHCGHAFHAACLTVWRREYVLILYIIALVIVSAICENQINIRSSCCPNCRIRCMRVGPLFLSRIDEVVSRLRNDLNDHSNMVNEVQDAPTIQEHRGLNRIEPTAEPTQLNRLQRNKAQEKKNEHITVGGIRHSHRQCSTISRLTYIKCVVCNSLKVMSTNLQSSIFEGYICSIDCLSGQSGLIT